MDQRITLTLTRSLLRAIDEWRRRQPDLPNRNQAIRQMIEMVVRGVEERS